MKSPVTGKEMVIKSEWINHEFRKENFRILYHYYLCEKSKQRFEDEQLAQLNLNQVYNQFRRKHNLPFPEEIISLHQQYDLSAAKMSEVLGFGINVYRNYENGEIPSLSNGRLIQLAQDPREFRRIINLGDALKDKDRQRLLIRIDELLMKSGSDNFSLQDFLMGERKADETTGYRIPSIERLSQMVIFCATETEPWKTKLNKLLFYSDFIHFKKTGRSISGCRYRALDMGPVPENFNSIFEHLAKKNQVEICSTVFPNGSIGEQFKPHPKQKFNSTIFEEIELTTLRQVIKIFGQKNTREIIDMSHEEDLWRKNYEDGKKLISYLEAFNLKYSVERF